ncbi:MAG: ATP-NAD kinase family protein [Deltaproteobacteria bacterium]|nr:ATP-NAD kinase family protein [Deltaproteobacteria bacterium]
MKAKKRLGLIVNPIAGMGGKIGLKGSDGKEIIARAKELGAQPESPKRTADALRRLFPIRERIELITYPHDMGENEARECGLHPIVIGKIKQERTSEEDTRKAADDMLRMSVDLLLFAGGDGTARDIYSVIGNKLPVLGIPSGVKIHSAVYGATPRKAGELAVMYLTMKSSEVRLKEAEVMDIDEQAFRENMLFAKLFGYLKIPYIKRMVQSAKAGGCAGERQALNAIAVDVINNMEEDCIYIIGPGTTTRTVMKNLGLGNTLLGVDAVCNRELVGSDLNEAQLLDLIKGKKAKIVVGIIGSQGYIFGRGNQQISAEVIKKTGRENIMILATMEKVATLNGAPLLTDTGNAQVDKDINGYMQVIKGLGERIMLKVES